MLKLAHGLVAEQGLRSEPIGDRYTPCPPPFGGFGGAARGRGAGVLPASVEELVDPPELLAGVVPDEAVVVVVVEPVSLEPAEGRSLELCTSPPEAGESRKPSDDTVSGVADVGSICAGGVASLRTVDVVTLSAGAGAAEPPVSVDVTVDSEGEVPSSPATLLVVAVGGAGAVAVACPSVEAVLWAPSPANPTEARTRSAAAATAVAAPRGAWKIAEPLHISQLFGTTIGFH